MPTAITVPAKAPVVATPQVCKPITKGGRTFSMLVPLAGVTGQDATPYTSEWLPVGAGAVLQLRLDVARVKGTLCVILETLAVPETDAPRFCGSFPQTNVAGSVKATMVCDEFVRVVATPGTGALQSADWAITGDAILSGAPEM